MDYERDGDTVTIHLRRDFNLLTARHLRQIAQGAERVRVDLSQARLVDSEALAALWALQNDGTHVILVEPPALFYEAVEVLDLEEVFEVDVEGARSPR